MRNSEREGGKYIDERSERRLYKETNGERDGQRERRTLDVAAEGDVDLMKRANGIGQRPRRD